MNNEGQAGTKGGMVVEGDDYDDYDAETLFAIFISACGGPITLRRAEVGADRTTSDGVLSW